MKLKVGAVLEGYRRLLADRRYFGFALAGALSMAGMFAYISGSPFVFIELFVFRRTGLAGSLGPMHWVLLSPPKSMAGWFAVLSR